ncbi:MAG: DUF2238 domain-containing protein [Candidatus Kaiserbacteria bacterium]|nr:DUF2238 domain-containing protein [Candidatus Kaiserbacteria bacterium]
MNTYQKILAAALVLVWVIAAIHPPDREGWLLENVIVFIGVPVIVLIGRYFRLSNFSWTCLAVFMVLHIVGSHWTYARVPFGDFVGHLIGTDRNMYDRVVHFSFGLFFAYPMREIFVRVTGARGIWSYLFPFDVVLSLSALYEIFEWATAIIVDPNSAATFIGSQGDFWDTQKDMATAGVGALIAVICVFAYNMIRTTGSRQEMRESFKIG